MGVENFRNEALESKRSTKRARVLLAAKLQTKYGEIDARLRDLSRNGALVECLEVPPVGTEVTFLRGTIAVPARVAWTGTDRIGLEFLFPIDEQEVLVHLGRNASAKPRGYDGAALAPRWNVREREAARAWGVVVGLTIPESDG